MPTKPYSKFKRIWIEDSAMVIPEDAGKMIVKMAKDTQKQVEKKLSLKWTGFSKGYLHEVTSALDQIAKLSVGHRMLSDIDKAGKDVTIAFPGRTFLMAVDNSASLNKAKAASPKAFREPIGKIDPLHELQQAFQRSSVTEFEMACFMLDSAKFGGFAFYTNYNEVIKWLTGKKLFPTQDRLDFRYLVLALEPWLSVGRGSTVLVSFDPWGGAAKEERPAHVGLFHELVHAWYEVSGCQIFTDDHLENERMVIGMPGFDKLVDGTARPYTENKYRSALGLKLRLEL